MEPHTTLLESTSSSDKQISRRQSLIDRIDQLFAFTHQNGLAMWDLSFPSKEGRPGLGVTDNCIIQKGMVILSADKGNRVVTLKAIPGEKLSRPLTRQIHETEPEHEAQYDALQINIQPDGQSRLLGINTGQEPALIEDA